jgi:hypothetical protein
LCEAWAKDFVLFLVGIGGQNRMDDEGMQLFRPDDGQPWSNTNFQWIRSE